MPDMQPGHEAVMHLARVLEQRPHKDDHELSFATRCLAAFREQLIEAHRATTSARDRENLFCLNGIISIVMGMHFPLGNAPWDEFEKTICWLKELVERTEGLPA